MSPLLRDYRPASADPRTNLPAPLPGTDLVEATTAEEAIAEVHRRHGRSARIVAAEKVRRGGISGFFARELVQLRVELDDPEPPAVRRVPAPPVPPEVTPTAGPSTGHAATDARLASGTLTAAPSVRAASGPAADEARNPLLAALVTDDGPPGETFGEMLDRRAAAGGSVAPRGGVTRAVDAMTRATDDREESFGAALRSAMADDADAGPAVRVLAGEEVAAARTTTPGRPDVPMRGAASLIDAPGRAGGAASLVVDRVGAPTDDPGARRLAASIAQATAAAAERAAEATTTHATAPTASIATLTGNDAPVAQDAVLEAEDGVDPIAVGDPPDAAPSLDRTTSLDPTVDAAAPPGDDTATSGVTDPLPARHEAIRQLRACTLDEGPRRAPTSDTTTPGRWSDDALARVGVPPAVVAAALAHEPTDDIGWLTAVARAVAPLCRPLGVEAEVVLGRRATTVAAHLGAQVVSLDERAAPRGSCALASARTPDARRWLAEERRGRTLHLVVGGVGWRDWLLDGPTVVSWTRGEDLTDALDAAARFGLTLGWSLGGDGARRATPVDVAIELRTRVVGA